jgi:hypothetical protein
MEALSMNRTDPRSAKTPSKGVSRRKFLADAALATAAVAAGPRLCAAQPASLKLGSAVRVDASRVLNAFDPDIALGSSMDILPPGVVDKIYTGPMIEECLSAGWGPITYRQNTELQIAAWHWNPNGVWSDAKHSSGYFTGNSEPGAPIRHSYGYPLPHRGSTRDGAAGIRGYSRLTDGDPTTYWKSNPYLAQRFTGEDESLHPQWVVIDLGAVEAVNVVRIDWAHPYARKYEVQFWTGTEDAMARPLGGRWQRFAAGTVANGEGGRVTLQLVSEPQTARFLRIWMTESSNTVSTHDAEDPRSSLGYAIHEISVGTFASNGDFVDLVHHAPDAGQTATYCSSTDPWHAAEDLDLSAGDQTGFDLFFTSGITRGLPAMIPVAILFGSPEDSAAQLAYLKRRGYSISFVEMGEEPDGQFMLPEDYAALYVQWAAALHKVDPELKLGGPVFTGLNEDLKVWPDAQGRSSWLGRFVDYLRGQGRLDDLAFVSFEHYPYAPCEITWADLYREPELIAHTLQAWREDGVPGHVPLINSESNVTYELSEAMTEIFSGLWLADSVGAFLAAGGYAYYHSPIQPEPLRPGCHGWTTYGNFVADEGLHIRTHTAQYHAGRLINLAWVKHGGGQHRLCAAEADLRDGAGNRLITVYAVQRPGGEWSLMLINKDQLQGQRVRVKFVEDGGKEKEFGGPVQMMTFGSEQYEWRSEGANSHPDPDLPPRTATLRGGEEITLPKASVTVITGRVD